MTELDLMSSLWKYYILDNSSEFFSYNILPFIVHQLAFYLFNLPFILFFFLNNPFIETFNIHKVKRKINLKKKKKMTNQEYGTIFVRVLLIQFFVAFPISLGGKNVFDATGAFSILLPLPSVLKIIIDVFACVMLDDLLFYIGHRLVRSFKFNIVSHKILV
jgi:sterol desaturase/sphingolipid hydroxylase (fatty acid hydroxylase superfamily)